MTNSRRRPVPPALPGPSDVRRALVKTPQFQVLPGKPPSHENPHSTALNLARSSPILSPAIRLSPLRPPAPSTVYPTSPLPSSPPHHDPPTVLTSDLLVVTQHSPVAI